MAFYKSAPSKDGYGNICKPCGKEYARSDEAKKARKLRDANNREELTKKHNEYIKLNRKMANKIQRNYYYSHWECNRKKKNEYDSRPERKAANSAKAAKRRAQLATSSFGSFAKEIRDFYNECPPGFHVDHIVPLNGDNVSGLHVPWNLQYLPASTNLKKSNKF
jgi:hypothetical protein